MDRNAQLTDILFQCVREYSEQAGNELHIDAGLTLIGPESPIDSLGLVMLVTSFEAKVNDKFDAQIVLANESALSMKRSPFRSVQTLASYAGELLGTREAA